MTRRPAVPSPTVLPTVNLHLSAESAGAPRGFGAPMEAHGFEAHGFESEGRA